MTCWNELTEGALKSIVAADLLRLSEEDNPRGRAQVGAYVGITLLLMVITVMVTLFWERGLFIRLSREVVAALGQYGVT